MILFLYVSEEEEKNISDYNFDIPNAIDFEDAYKHLYDLISGKTVKLAKYNFVTSRREEHIFLEIKPCSVLLYEGIYAFYDKV
jgi:uridine kinase